MEGITWKLNNYTFASETEYIKGKKDLNKIKHIISKIDIENPENAKKLYNNLKIRSNYFDTIIGEQFLIKLVEIFVKDKVKQQQVVLDNLNFENNLNNLKCKNRIILKGKKIDKRIVLGLSVGLIFIIVICAFFINNKGLNKEGYCRGTRWGMSVSQVENIEDKEVDTFNSNSDYLTYLNVNNLEYINGTTGKVEYEFEGGALKAVYLTIQTEDENHQDEIIKQLINNYNKIYGQTVTKSKGYYIEWNTDITTITIYDKSVSMDGKVYITYKKNKINTYR